MGVYALKRLRARLRNAPFNRPDPEPLEEALMRQVGNRQRYLRTKAESALRVDEEALYLAWKTLLDQAPGTPLPADFPNRDDLLGHHLPYTRLEDLFGVDREELVKVKGIGPVGARTILDRLEEGVEDTPEPEEGGGDEGSEGDGQGTTPEPKPEPEPEPEPEPAVSYLEAHLTLDGSLLQVGELELLDGAGTNIAAATMRGFSFRWNGTEPRMLDGDPDTYAELNGSRTRLTFRFDEPTTLSALHVTAGPDRFLNEIKLEATRDGSSYETLIDDTGITASDWQAERRRSYDL